MRISIKIFEVVIIRIFSQYKLSSAKHVNKHMYGAGTFFRNLFGARDIILDFLLINSVLSLNKYKT